MGLKTTNYEVAKTEVKTVEGYNENGELETKKGLGVLYGWDNDIVGE